MRVLRVFRCTDVECISVPRPRDRPNPTNPRARRTMTNPFRYNNLSQDNAIAAARKHCGGRAWVPVQVVSFGRWDRVLRQFYSVVYGRGRVVRQALQSDFLFGHEFACNAK